MIPDEPQQENNPHSDPQPQVSTVTPYGEDSGGLNSIPYSSVDWKADVSEWENVLRGDKSLSPVSRHIPD